MQTTSLLKIRKLLNNKVREALLINAQKRAKDLLTSYVMNIGAYAGKQYKIVWVDADENGSPIQNKKQQS